MQQQQKTESFEPRAKSFEDNNNPLKYSLKSFSVSETTRNKCLAINVNNQKLNNINRQQEEKKSETLKEPSRISQNIFSSWGGSGSIHRVD